jgi:hypothetical protein
MQRVLFEIFEPKYVKNFGNAKLLFETFSHFDKCGTYGGEKNVHIEFRYGNLKETDHLESLGIDWSVIIRMDLK